ncbi:hypothetical protein TNCV_2291531 [Trichonephila clavipes]|uniref:Uncharacterized protein n=1 Tax=Trichonephila clavipes TaxID=2585209 RepID=A0A8X6RL87_TRICX|nr:hypothetical protein TNCV_2291531 [Trichonephila clavipes]
MMFKDDCGFPASPDEYAMRIAAKLNLLSSVKSTRTHSLSLNSGVPSTTENVFSDGQALKVHTVQGVVQTDHHRAVFWPQ